MTRFKYTVKIFCELERIWEKSGRKTFKLLYQYLAGGTEGKYKFEIRTSISYKRNRIPTI
jgi:hypothetical protein